VTDASLETGNALPGQLLREARATLGLDTAKAAADLRVTPELIEAMESNRFEAFDAPVYAKGFLRQYAALLALDPAAVVAAYESQTVGRPSEPTLVPVTPAAPLVRFRTARRIRWPSLRSVAWTLALVVLLAAGYWYSGYRSASLRTSPPVAAVPVVKSEAPAAPAVSVETAPMPDSIPLPGEANGPTTAPARLPIVADAVTIRGIREAWVEIRDADGNRIFYDHVRAGEMHTARGVGPWRIYLSDVDGVEVSLGAHIVDVPATRRTGIEARFGLKADGTIL
jgi:cytoskeleton protein RodZ